LLEPLVLVELFIVANVAFLAADIIFAHSTNEFAHWAEWIPLVFSLTAPLVLIAVMLVAKDVRPPMPSPRGKLTKTDWLARILGLAVGWSSILIGLAGLLWHLESQFFEEQTLKNLVYAAPFVAPLAYSGLGFLILLDRMVPSDTDAWAQWIIFLALGGWVGNFALSLADHAQNAFFYWPEWIPVIASALAIGGLVVAIVDFRNRLLLSICLGLMVVEIVVGVAGWILHLDAIATSPMQELWTKLIYSAPLFAPLLFVDLALLAMIGLGALLARSGESSGMSSP
jgi:hypothetical protein